MQRHKQLKWYTFGQKGNSSLKIEYLHIYIDERLKTNWLTVYEASKILRWMLGQTPQHPNKTKLRTQNNRVLRKTRRLTTDSGVLNWINGVLDADPGYLRLHHKTMQANWHQYMECMSMRAGPLNNNLSLKGVQENTYLGSVRLMNNWTQYKTMRHMQYI